MLVITQCHSIDRHLTVTLHVFIYVQCTFILVALKHITLLLVLIIVILTCSLVVLIYNNIVSSYTALHEANLLKHVSAKIVHHYKFILK